jgi:DNA-directed RNA polymerase subunit RPC12/RpoP
VAKLSLKTHSPHLEGEFDVSRNAPLRFEELSYGSRILIWWKCSVGHQWEQAPTVRTRKKNPGKCPYCSGRRISEINSLQFKAPHLEAEYHPDNKLPFKDVSFGSTRKCKWRCSKYPEHVWDMSPNTRTASRQGCPYCAGKILSPLNALKTQAPHLEKEYHPDNPLPFGQIKYGSHTPVLWRCSVDSTHVWSAPPNNRTNRKSQCPYCSGKIVTPLTSLKAVAPWLEAEYHPDNPIPFDKMFGNSSRKALWICSKNPKHRAWSAVVAARTKRTEPTGCPSCFKAHHSKAELEIYAKVLEVYPDALSGQNGLLRSKGLELDIYVPSLRKAIEYDGAYFHPEGQERDIRKNRQCKEANIDLLRIPEHIYVHRLGGDPVTTLAKIFQWLASPIPQE